MAKRPKAGSVARDIARKTDEGWGTDAFHVLSRKPTIPEMVVSKRFLFEVGIDGGIKYVGRPDDLPGK